MVGWHGWLGGIDCRVAWMVGWRPTAFGFVVAQVLFVSNHTRYKRGAVYEARNSTYINSTEEALGAIRDIVLMSEANLFVCSLSSFFGRTAIRLMMASGRLWEWAQIASVDADPFKQAVGPGFPFQFSYRQ